MKPMIFMTALAMMLTAQAKASCGSAALWAAETVYGNDPMKTVVKPIRSPGPEISFEVTVGIGNHEDGAHTYMVTFEGPTCDPKTAIVCDETIPENSDPRVCHQ